MKDADEAGAAGVDQKVDSVFPTVDGARPNADAAGTSPTEGAEGEAEVKLLLRESAARCRQADQK